MARGLMRLALGLVLSVLPGTAADAAAAPAGSGGPATPLVPPDLTQPLEQDAPVRLPPIPQPRRFAGKFLLAAFPCAAAAVYVAFQKKILPKSMSRIVSKVYFWPTIPITAALRWRNLWTTVDDTVILGVAPCFWGMPGMLHRMGVRGVVNLQDEWKGPVDAYKTLGIDQLRLPTVDHFEVSVGDLREAVKFIAEYKQKGQKVYVHCKAGHGRGGGVAFAWLMSQDLEADPKVLQQQLSKKRKVRKTLYKQNNLLILRDLYRHERRRRNPDLK